MPCKSPAGDSSGDEEKQSHSGGKVRLCRPSVTVATAFIPQGPGETVAAAKGQMGGRPRDARRDAGRASGSSWLRTALPWPHFAPLLVGMRARPRRLEGSKVLGRGASTPGGGRWC